MLRRTEQGHLTGLAPAKVNLTLHVTGQRSDGYHLLDSLVVFADVGDSLSLTPGGDLCLSVDGPMFSGVPTDDSNLILKAARWMGADSGALHLEKRLPAAAGIGGGSSDAATALRLIAEAMGCEVPPGADALGADVPVCLRGRATRMSGIGDVLADVPELPALPAVLVNPGVGVSTPRVFGALRDKSNPSMPDVFPRFASQEGLVDWLRTQRNDLEPPARSLAPVIGAVLEALGAQAGCQLARMSGSGATCFGLFETRAAAEAAANRLSAQPWWVVATTLR